MQSVCWTSPILFPLRYKRKRRPLQEGYYDRVDCILKPAEHYHTKTGLLPKTFKKRLSLYSTVQIRMMLKKKHRQTKLYCLTNPLFQTETSPFKLKVISDLIIYFGKVVTLRLLVFWFQINRFLLYDITDYTDRGNNCSFIVSSPKRFIYYYFFVNPKRLE